MSHETSILIAGLLLAAACAGLAYQSIRLRQRLARLTADWTARHDATSAWAEGSTLRQDQLTETLQQHEASISSLHRQLEDLARAPRTADGYELNLTQRLRVIRLSQRGESASHISAVLGIPQAEVELIIKLYPLTLV